MALVDYSSSSSSSSDRDDELGGDADAGPPPAKRRKDADAERTGDGPNRPPATDPGLPPLPPAFHDLYASSVRQSVVDDPSLHHGRTRQTPHVIGNWPTHLYVEWYPTPTQHQLLVELIRQVRAQLGPGIELHSFMTSDLGAPLPLHISLSRPLTLTTAVKDDFLERVAAAIRGTGTNVFGVRPRALLWYRSPDSNRTFLVLQIASAGDAGGGTNRELTALLAKCNAVAERFGQPPLYQSREGQAVGGAFHVSVGWTFAPPDGEAAVGALELFKQEQFADVRSWEIEVSGVKAKIGNVATHIPLGSTSGSKPVNSLFGV